MKRKILSAIFMSTFSMISYANSPCHDFSGHYRFEGDCGSSKELILPTSHGFYSAQESPYAPMTSKGSFEIKQEGCDKVTLISHRLIKDSNNEFRTSTEEFTKKYDGYWNLGNKTIISINNNKLKIGHHRWDWSYNPLLLILRTNVKSIWRIKKTDVPSYYNLNIRAENKTWADIFADTRNENCSLKRDS